MRDYTAETPIEEVLEEYEIFLSGRAYNCVKRHGINTIGEFMEISEEELRNIRNLGLKGYEELNDARKKLARIHILSAEEIRETARQKAKEDIKMLDELIGLDDVKLQVKKLISLARMQQYMKEQGVKGERLCLNMEFVGNPGTAKTTVARIMARILSGLGFVPGNKLYEVGRADLVGEYVGQTAAKVKKLFKEAKGNVIFIDEAYSLADHDKGSYGDEAISTLVKEMEDNREDTIVIFAGYPKEMNEFMARNAGLRSRVPFRIQFKDYSAEEMVLISQSLARNNGFSIEPKAVNKIKELCSQNSVSAGNGRLCRNMVIEAMMSFASRNFDANDMPSGKIRFTLKAQDFKLPDSVKTDELNMAEGHRIGFCI